MGTCVQRENLASDGVMAGSKTGGNGAKTKAGNPRNAAPRAITVRTPLLKSLSGQLAVAAAAAGVVVILLLGVMLLRTRSAVTKLERGGYAQLATDARLRLDRLTGRDRSRLMEAAFSDDLYALLERGPAPPDSFVRPGFADRFITRYNDRFIGLYDLAGRRLFGIADSSQAELEAVATSNPFLRTLDNREPTVGLVRAGNQLYWVGGAPVLPTNYADASRPIRGYLVIAQPLAPSALAPSAGDRTARLELDELPAAKTPFPTRVEIAAGDSVRVEFALTDVFAQPNTLASLTTSRGEFHAIDSTFRSLWLTAVVFSILFSLLLWFAATRFLVAPTVRTSAALAAVHQGNIPNLINAPSSVTEWTTMVGAINRLISNSRTRSERFDRLTAVVADGGFEYDLTNREWSVGSRLGQMLGLNPGESPLDALTRLVHPEDASQILPWLAAEVPAPRRNASVIRLRRPGGGDWWWARFEAEVGTDLAGQPMRVTGRLTDVSADRAAVDQRAELVAAFDARMQRQGRFLSHVADLIRHTADPTLLGGRLDLLARAMDAQVTTELEAFDLHSLLQEAVGSEPTEITVVPGVPTTVNGDRPMVMTLLEELLALADRTAGRVTLRAEQPEKGQPALIRLVVEDRRTTPITGLKGALEQVDTDAVEPRLDASLIHYLAKALGGRASATSDGGITRLWFELPLPGVETPGANAEAEFADSPTWERSAEPATTTFEPEAAPAQNRRAGDSTAGPVELVADATVVIDFDAPAPPPTASVSTRVREALAQGDAATLRTARIALADTPIRLAELRGAIRAGESRTVSQIAQAVRTIADALEARAMASRCSDILDAVEGQYLESAEHLVQALDGAWQQVKDTIGGLATAPDRPTTERSPIDPATFDQLVATTTADGLGLGNQLVSLFLAEAPVRIESAERALERGDLGVFKGAIGDLKGMCGLIGATALAEGCAAAGALDDLSTAAPILTVLRDELRRVHDILEPLLGVRAGA
jgi:PAS domain-containing protein/HPt (histidine-containing phosphotransfer) domain-containing protein